MMTRRGVHVASDLRLALSQFKPGDIVTSVITGSVDFIGEVINIDEKVCKLSVDWGDGSLTQHGPDEVQHLPHLLVERMEKEWKASSRRGSLSKEASDLRPFVEADELTSRRDRSAMTKEEADTNPQFVGDPKVHGIDQPRGGGFSIMQDLQKDLRKESGDDNPKLSEIQASHIRTASIVESMVTSWNDDGSITEAKETTWTGDDAKIASDSNSVPSFKDIQARYAAEGKHHCLRLTCVACGNVQTCRCSKEKVNEAGICHECSKTASSPLRSRRAMYWTDRDRIYRLTKNEQGEGKPACPKCREEMEKQRFTKNDKLYNCPSCGFKIPSSKTVTHKKVEIEIEPDGTVEVEVEASMRRCRSMSASNIKDILE